MSSARMLFVVALTGVLTVGFMFPAGAIAPDDAEQIEHEVNTIAEQGLPQDQEFTYEKYRALFDDLKSSDVPQSEEVVDGETIRTFEVDGFEFSMADVAEEDFTPDLGGGIDGGGVYITFNQVDQGALIAGAGAGLAAAICAIPAVGQVACVVAAVIVGAATFYVLEYGRCANDGLLKVYVTQPNFAFCV